jgi:hypothetical protein
LVKATGVGVTLYGEKGVEDWYSGVSKMVTDPVEDDLATASTSVELPAAFIDGSALSRWLYPGTFFFVEESDTGAWAKDPWGDPIDCFNAACESTAVNGMAVTYGLTLEGCFSDSNADLDRSFCVRVSVFSFSRKLLWFIWDDNGRTGSEDTITPSNPGIDGSVVNAWFWLSRLLFGDRAEAAGCAEVICFDSDDWSGAASMSAVDGLLVDEPISAASLDKRATLLRLKFGDGTFNDGPVLMLPADGEFKFAEFGGLAAWEVDGVAAVPTKDVGSGSPTGPGDVTKVSLGCIDGIDRGRLVASSIGIEPRLGGIGSPDAWASDAVAVRRPDGTGPKRLAGPNSSGESVTANILSVGAENVERPLGSNALKDGGAYMAAVSAAKTSGDAVNGAISPDSKEAGVAWSRFCASGVDAIGKKTPGDPAFLVVDPAAADAGSFDIDASFRNAFNRSCSPSQVLGEKSCPFGHVSLTI